MGKREKGAKSRPFLRFGYPPGLLLLVFLQRGQFAGEEFVPPLEFAVPRADGSVHGINGSCPVAVIHLRGSAVATAVVVTHRLSRRTILPLANGSGNFIRVIIVFCFD